MEDVNALIENNEVTSRLLGLLQLPFAEQLEAATVSADTQVLVNQRDGLLKVVSCGEMLGEDEQEAFKLRLYGDVVTRALARSSIALPRLRRIAEACLSGEITTVDELRLRLERRLVRPRARQIEREIGPLPDDRHHRRKVIRQRHVADIGKAVRW